MSPCAASCCTCCPKASSAFATSVSWPAGGVPLFCRFAFNFSARSSHRRPNQKPPLPRNRVRFGSAPSAAAPWSSSRDLRPPKSNFVLPHTRLRLLHETMVHNPKTLCASRRSAPLRLAAEPISSHRCFPPFPSHRFAVLPASPTRPVTSTLPRTALLHLDIVPPLH